MIRLLASSALTRSASRRLTRMIPNPFLRTVAIAAAAYGIERLVMGAAHRVPRRREGGPRRAARQTHF